MHEMPHSISLLKELVHDQFLHSNRHRWGKGQTRIPRVVLPSFPSFVAAFPLGSVNSPVGDPHPPVVHPDPIGGGPLQRWFEATPSSIGLASTSLPSLPFGCGSPSNPFDGVFCNCVFPFFGVFDFVLQSGCFSDLFFTRSLMFQKHNTDKIKTHVPESSTSQKKLQQERILIVVDFVPSVCRSSVKNKRKSFSLCTHSFFFFEN